MDDASPPTPKRLCLNMIVRNETANLPRCLDAVAPHIACWVIGDTGSTDGTQDFIRSYFAERGIPGELHSFPFVNFEQARNAALDHAYASPLPYDYLLFDDADMELVVDEPAFRTHLDAPGYSMMQRDESLLAYWNVRLVRRDVRARYHGVTHEYLDAPGGSLRLPGAWYKDHASGANRTEKLARDIRLLRGALETDPDNHRTWYYLAQCYRDAGQTQDAAETFAKRAAMGGWDEEAWNARLQQARCLRKLGDAAGFVRTALEALDQRPSRAEPLYDLAHYYREIGKYDESAACAERGLAIPRPDQDILFVEDFVYTAGLQEELSIAAFYSKDPERKARGLAACERLALTRSVPQPSRDAARLNLNFYVEPLRALAPSFAPHRIAFQPPDGWRALNPSIARWNDRIVAVQRTVNYELRDDGHYVTFDGSPITTRNYLLHLNDTLEITSAAEIMPPADWPPPHYELVRGFEDARLFAWRDALWCTATVRDQTPEGWCEQILARIDGPDAGTYRLTDWRVLRPQGERKHEKNWMPLVDGDALRFIYLCDPTRLIDDTARTVAEFVPPIAADEFKGGSQAIAFDDGWLAVIHEVTMHGGNRSYHHRFVWFDAAGALHKLSRRFYLQRKGVEFVAGLAWHPDARRLLLSYGVADSETRLATVEASEVRDLLIEVGRPPRAPEDPVPVQPLTATEKEKAVLEAAPKETADGGDSNSETRRLGAVRHMTIALHVLGVAHTIPNEDYLACAFTSKVLLFPEVIQPFGWDVIEYSNEGSASQAREHVVILTKDRLRALTRRASREEPLDADVTNKELQQEFQRNLIEKIQARARPGDIVCHVWGPNMEVYHLLPNCHHIELSVGYTASPGLPLRVYESSAWMHWHYGKAGQEDGNHYKWVIPSAFDDNRWTCCEEPDNYALFLGRVTQRKGLNELVAISRRMPELPIHVYGQGDPSHWANGAPANLLFKGPVFGDARIDVVRRARCMLMPTVFIEPFGFSGVEAQLCGVPLIATSYGAFQETILDGITGYRCHTLADWVAAIKLSELLDRRRIAALARSRYSKEVIGKQYDWTLRQLADLSDRGWYGEELRKFPCAVVGTQAAKPAQRRIWLYIPYFGAFPNYFQLYLDSQLGNNADCLSVFLLTDNDMSGYRVPNNLVTIPMTLGALRENAAQFIRDNLGMDVQPDALLKQPYKFCDFRIIYPELFRDISDQYGVTEDDFVGWGDCDLIYGRFADFLDMDEEYHVIGGFHGHLTAFRNIHPFRQLFKALPSLPEILIDEKSHLIDEVALRGPLLELLKRNQYRMFYSNRYFCDIVPECFFDRFRQDHAQRKKNFFDAYHPDKDIDHVYYGHDGRLTVVYDDGDSRSSIYCHLQKRAMSLDFDRHESGYYIREEAFCLAS